MSEKKTKYLRIAGHDYKIRGAESDEQIRLVERCLNDKIGALKKLFSVQGMDFETITMLAAINLADDYIKAEEQLKQFNQTKIKLDKLMRKEKQLEKDLENCEEELFRLESENQDYANQVKQLTQEKLRLQQALEQAEKGAEIK